MIQPPPERCVHVSLEVRNRLESLEKSGGTGTAYARKANRIIQGLTSKSGRESLNGIGCLTRFGEKRLKKCHKYNLGGGFRLIIVQRGPNVLVRFLGTHDECQRWLENRNHRKPGAEKIPDAFHVLCPGSSSSREEQIDPENRVDDGPDEKPLEINDQDLRHIFRGLVEAAAGRPPDSVNPMLR